MRSPIIPVGTATRHSGPKRGEAESPATGTSQIVPSANRRRPARIASRGFACVPRLFAPVVALVLCAATSVLADFTKQPDETLPGFKSEQVYDFGSVDSVNLYSGEAHVAVPLGPKYPLSSGLSWQLEAHYSSKLWHMFQYEADYDNPDCPGAPLFVTRAHLNGTSTIGVGWTLELGSVRPAKGDSLAVYRSPDGAQHNFGNLDTDADLRLDPQGDGTYLVRKADGTVLRFTHLYEIPAPVNGFDFSDEDRPGAVINDTSRQTLRYGLTSITDRFGKTVLNVTYLANCAAAPCPANAWKVASVQLSNPTRTIQFNWGVHAEGSLNYPVVESIDFPVTDGATLTTSFAFKPDGTLRREAFDSGVPPYPATDLIPAGPDTTRVPFLDSITQADRTYSFEYDASDRQMAGVMTTLKLPTGGRIVYGYSGHTAFYPQRCGTGETCVPEVDAGTACPAGSDPEEPDVPSVVDFCTLLARRQPFIDASPAVTSRTEQDLLGGAPDATTTYERKQFGSAVGADEPVESDRVVRRVIVKRPDGNGRVVATKHIFAAGFVEGGLPGTGGRAGFELLRRYYADCDTGGTPVRSVVQCYPKTPTIPYPTNWACGVMESATRVASLSHVFSVRPIQVVTWYGVNPLVSDKESCHPSNSTPCWQDEYSDLNADAWEYRTVTRSANSGILINPQTATRTTTTNWTPITNPDGTWLPKLYSWKTVTDAPCDYAPCTVTTSFSFNTDNGFLNSTWVTDPTYGTLASTRVMDPMTGNARFESLSATFDSKTYTNTRTFRSGLVESVRRTAPTNVTWKSFDVTRDATTGLITTSRDPNGLAATYAYDSLSRLQSVTPPGELATAYCYKGWNTTYEMSTVFAKRGGSSCAESDGVPGTSHGPFDAYQYDGLGRLRREMRRLPNTLTTGSYFSFRETRYNAAGLVAFESEWTPCGVSPSATSVRSCYAATATKGTTYSNFDFLGRARRIQQADDSVITKSFDDPAGLPNSDFTEMVSRSVSGVIVNSGARKDILGRLLIVGEPAPAPAPYGLTTDYHYNVLDKLVEVKVGTGSGDPNEVPPATPQTRTFAYDAHGLLRSETHPEKGTTTYESYDALGNPQGKTEQDGTTYQYTYDALGRLKTSAAGGQTLLSNGYDEPLDENGNSRGSYKGKLTTATGYNNYPSMGYDVQFYPRGTATDSLYYSGIGGRLSGKTTTLSNGSVSPATSWTYNNLGLVATESHPRIPLTGTFSVTTGYVSGLPRTLSAAGQTVASSIAYDPAGGLASYTSGNGITTTITPDPNGMPRPRQIATSNSFSTGLYSYDGSGNIISIGTDLFSYDAKSRLLSARYAPTTQYYGYDWWGNLIQKAGVSNPVDPATNRLTGAGYDARGNLTVLGGETYAYDALNRQTRQDGSAGHWSYLFDAASERIVKSIPPSTGTLILRRDMARIILQALGEKPRATYAGTFADVPSTDPERGWIERFYELGITAGCATNPLRFCPNGTLTRWEMAIFLATAMALPNAVPASGTVTGVGNYNCAPSDGTSLFADVPANDGGCKFIHYLFKEGVTAGCAGPPNPRSYCPMSPTSHWEMEVFASRKWPTFGYVPPQAKYTFRGAGGSILTEFQDSAVSKDYVYLGNRLVGTNDTSGWQYHVTDHLGSIRQTTDAAGTVLETHKYWPWGEEAGTTGAGTLRFAGMELDLETARPRYYDHARNYETGFGRFLTPDVLTGSVEDPQSWNRYTYARNNPLKYVDPDGRSAVAAAVSLLAPLVNIPITPPQMVVLVGGSSIAAGRAIGGMTLGGTTIDERLTRLFTNWLAGPEQVDLGPLTLDRGGESPEAKYGREQHQAWDYGPGFEKEVRLPSGRRVDGLNPETREVRELKPDNPRAVRRGETQVQRYVKELEAKTREKWTGKVETYRRPKDNEDATKK